MRAVIFFIAILSAFPATAAESAPALDRAPTDPYDIASIQRGARIFVNYCLGCHNAAHMRYGRIGEDLGISPEQIRDNLIFGEFVPGASMMSAMNPAEAKEWFNQAAPPDLTLVARSRGADWLYAYMRGFYRDPSRPNGWNNLVFSNVAMPHALHELQGASAFPGAEGQLTSLEKRGEKWFGFFQATSGEEKEIALESISPGRLSSAEYDAAITDLVNFLVYMGEPSRNERVRVGFAVMLALFILLVLSYLLYREYWRDIE